jgi:hypothetical protein
VPQSPLGRIVAHDPRSKAYPYRAAPRTLKSITHTGHIPILDQGNLGSCTGNATVGALGCDPLYGTFPIGPDLTLDENLAVKVYSLATTLDDFPDTYPPTDSGSSGLGAAKAAQKLGLISGYQHAFTVADALAALQTGPVITGINWYESFFTPTSAGLISIAPRDKVAGGHEVCAFGYDETKQLVWFRNSWGPDWGVNGTFCMTVSTWAQLLAQQGDVTVFVPVTQPAPTPVPTPTPTPTPTVDQDVADWWAASKGWANAPHSGANRAQAARDRTLATRKGL